MRGIGIGLGDPCLDGRRSAYDERITTMLDE
jgi:hypothetical protein